MRASVDTWTEADGTGVSVAAVCPYLTPVSLALLESPDTQRLELLALCEARALPVDSNASKAVLRARLVAFNLSTRNVWCSRVQLLARHVWQDSLVDRSHMLPFQAAIAHRANVPAAFQAPSCIAKNPPRLPWMPSLPVVGRPTADVRPPPGPTEPARATRECAPLPMSSTPPPPLPPRPPALPTLPHAVPTLPPAPPLPSSAAQGSSGRPPAAQRHPSFPRQTPPLSSLTSLPDDPGSASTGTAGPAQFAYQLAQSLHQRDVETQRQELAVSSGLQQLNTAVANLGDVQQSAAYSQTVQLTRMEHTLVGLERAGTGAMVRSRSPPAAHTMPKKKRPKRGSARAVERLTEDAAPVPSASTTAPRATGSSDADPAGGGGESGPAGAPAPPTPLTFVPLVHGLMMEPELLNDTMVTAPLFTQLTYILRLAHVSPREPGIFGSYAVKRLHSVAQGRVEEAAAARGEPSGVNLEKAARIDNVIANKADIYVRILWWVHAVLPEKLGGEAQAGTAEAMRVVTITAADGEKLSAALDEHGRFLSKTGFKVPAKMTYSALRKMLNKLAVHDRAVSKVEQILSTSPFKERLAVTVHNVGRSYLEPTAAPT